MRVSYVLFLFCHSHLFFMCCCLLLDEAAHWLVRETPRASAARTLRRIEIEKSFSQFRGQYLRLSSRAAPVSVIRKRPLRGDPQSNAILSTATKINYYNQRLVFPE